ncbi:MAG: OmpA family protein [Thiomargarita sp.]|nr:OmpA family protein [Thiomargarita sp.]
MKKQKMISVLLYIAFLSGCSSKTQFVLMPDNEGKVGKMTITSEKGSQSLNKAWQSTGLDSPDTLPSEPEILEEKEVKRIFAQALKAQPAPAVSFLFYFPKGSNEPTAESLALIPEIIATIASRQSKDVSVIGHSDRVGSGELNYKLSLKRAKCVAKLLISKGVNRDILEITSYGEAVPLIKTADEVTEPKNRRVEITVR